MTLRRARASLGKAASPYAETPYAAAELRDLTLNRRKLPPDGAALRRTAVRLGEAAEPCAETP
jgi:hypothetical protein